MEPLGRRAEAAERRYRREGGELVGVDRCLIFVADPPFIRHDLEKSATENEKLICRQFCQEVGESRPDR